MDFSKQIEIVVMETCFKEEEHRNTYKSRERSAQVAYILCGRCILKELSGCKVVPGNSVANNKECWLVR